MIPHMPGATPDARFPRVAGAAGVTTELLAAKKSGP
jgi:hypothetical protein